MGALALTACSLSGCDDGAASTSQPDATELAQISGVSQTVTVPDPNGTYFAEVNANGTGCPPGTAYTSISRDGQVFTTTFSAYITEVNPSVSLSVKDCQLAVKLHTPEGRSFSVQQFSYSGYALLQPGVVGSQMASYYFQGGPLLPTETNRVQLTGPYDSGYLFTDSVPIDDRVWSECGVERDLNITTRVMLQNGNPKRAGYMNLSALDGSGRMELKIASRPCQIGREPAPGAALAKVSDVRVTPPAIQGNQPFTITWAPLASSPNASYTVELHEHFDFGYKLLWQSPGILGRSMTYNGAPLSGGDYHIVVVARDGNRTSTSDRIVLEVNASGSPTPNPPVSPAPSASLPAWARPLLGKYAVRIDAFAVSQVGPLVGGAQLGLAEFVQVGDGIELRTRVCAQRTYGFNTNVTLRTPEAHPELRRRVILEPGERFSTDDRPLAFGLQREGVPGCDRRGGQYVPKRPEQVWIRGNNCRCPIGFEEPRLDDCRITDPDGDGYPGLAFDWDGGNKDGEVSHTVGVTRGHLVNGRVDPGGSHRAAYVNDELTYQLVCERYPCDSATSGLPCAPEYNSAQFTRLPAPPSGQSEWTCATLRAAENRLFVRPSPSVPRSCSRGSQTPTP